MYDNSHNSETFDDKSLLNLALLLTLILFLIAIVSLYFTRSIRPPHGPGTLVVEESKNPFDDLVLEASSVLVADINTGEVYFEKNADEIVPLASITKIMTAVTALDILPQTSVITIDTSFLAQEGDSGLFGGEQWQLRDLLDVSLIESSNDAAAAIAATAGVRKVPEGDLSMGREQFIRNMNIKAASLGMATARFYNETGLDVSTEVSGGYSSARDLAKLYSYAIKKYPEIFEGTKESSVTIVSENNIGHNVTNTNKSVNKVPNIIASKTGYTDLAGGNLGIVFEPGLGNPIVVIVLGSSVDGRFTDVEKLSYAALEYIREER